MTTKVKWFFWSLAPPGVLIAGKRFLTYKELYSQYKEKGFKIINIDIQESQEKVSSFATKHKLPYPVLLDKDGQVASLYGVRGVPTKILINKDGIIICRACRSVDGLLKMLF